MCLWSTAGPTAVGAHVDLQRAGAGAALVALWEGTDALVGVGLLGFVLRGGGGGGGGGSGSVRLLLPAGAVVHEVGLQVPLAAVPDATVFAGEDVLWKNRRKHQEKLRPGHMPRPIRIKIAQLVASVKTCDHF